MKEKHGRELELNTFNAIADVNSRVAKLSGRLFGKMNRNDRYNLIGDASAGVVTRYLMDEFDGDENIHRVLDSGGEIEEELIANLATKAIRDQRHRKRQNSINELFNWKKR